MVQKRLFIGSSAEQLSILNEVVNLIGDAAKCIPWTNAFALNRSALDSLIKQTRLSDYAILIATKDDLIKKRGKKVLTPRDNIILEFGLFLGSTGADRCFLLAEKGAELPSDLHGINVSEFTREAGKHNSLDKVIAEIKTHIAKIQNGSELGLLPSTALAIGYYNGFIKKICEAVSDSQSISIEGKKVTVKSFKINVIIPESIDDNGVENFTNLYNKRHDLKKATTYVDIDMGKGRGYPFHFKVDPPEQDLEKPLEIHVSDVPNTLSTIVEALKLYLPTKEVGSDEDMEHLERRELDNFARVLKYLISKNILTKKNVTVEVDVTL